MIFGDLQDGNWKLGIWQGKAFNLSTQEAETTRLQVQDQPETLSQKQTRKNQAIAICKLSYESLEFILLLSPLFHCLNHPRFGSHGHWMPRFILPFPFAGLCQLRVRSSQSFNWSTWQLVSSLIYIFLLHTTFWLFILVLLVLMN